MRTKASRNSKSNKEVSKSNKEVNKTNKEKERKGKRKKMSTSNQNGHGSVRMKVPKITKNISKEEFSNWESLFGSHALVKGF